MKRFNI